eukprot:CAMPEP_0185021338 /NCGR_PEP_ID=MMETSP1103-20130426/4028_1 /TAXON_ID=36769 /ORGANISM="Paraphysomonas bandaiensis, Strain Caron Lab Isolate" /LENGTH=695 /DNA_ID=CAMNT_0027552803 /DNA_START=84 /DNA_END=2171 /DNA_ORIENTATION=-
MESTDSFKLTPKQKKKNRQRTNANFKRHPIKSFHVGGPIDAAEHYAINRSDVCDDIAQKLEAESYILLHAHRQAGKTSLIAPIVSLLLDRGFLPISVSLQGINEASFWESLYARMHAVCSAKINTPFSTSDSFLKAFETPNFDSRVIIVMDEFDMILSLSSKRNEILSTFRMLKTVNACDASKPYAISGILGIGVFHITELALPENTNTSSSFNISQCIRLEQPVLADVRMMFDEYGAQLSKDMREYCDDIYGRTHGHPGFTSLLGRILDEWVHRNGLNSITIGGWVAHMCGSLVYGELAQSSVVECVKASLLRVGKHVELAREITRTLLSGESISDPSSLSVDHFKAVNYMETEGIIVRVNTGSEQTIRFAAPLLRLALYSTFVTHIRTIPEGISLSITLIGSHTRELHMLNTLIQCLPFLDRNLLFQETSVGKDGIPFEFAYHFQLYGILLQMAVKINWRVTSEARSACSGCRKRMSIFVSNNGGRYGYELVANSSRNELWEHYNDQAIVYKKALNLSNVFVVNFISELPEDRPDWWHIESDPHVSVMHVYIPRPEKGNEIFVFHSMDKKEIVRISAAINRPQSTVLPHLETQLSLTTTPMGKPRTDWLMKMSPEKYETAWSILQDEKYILDGEYKSMIKLHNDLGIYCADDLMDVGLEIISRSMLTKLKLAPRNRLFRLLDMTVTVNDKAAS